MFSKTNQRFYNNSIEKKCKGFSWMPRSNTKGREKRKLYGGNGEIQVSKRGNPHEKRTKRTETS